MLVRSVEKRSEHRGFVGSIKIKRVSRPSCRVSASRRPSRRLPQSHLKNEDLPRYIFWMLFASAVQRPGRSTWSSCRSREERLCWRVA